MEESSGLLKAAILWGKLFRFLFIASVEFISYIWFDPQSIVDTPFSELTLRSIANNLLGGFIPVGCVYWFFTFPEVNENQNSEYNPYLFWSNLSVLVALISAIAYYFLYVHA